MSTLQCANIHFESTQNNRIQYLGSNNYALVAGGSNAMTINSTVIAFASSLTSANLALSFKTTDYTLANSDSGTTIFVTNATTSNVTIPNNLVTGFRVYVVRLGTGNTKFVNATGLSMFNKNSGNTINTQYGSGSVLVINSTACVIDGQI
jgi:hypothetical protein